jgi:hypothetical protein
VGGQLAVPNSDHLQLLATNSLTECMMRLWVRGCARGKVLIGIPLKYLKLELVGTKAALCR